MERNLVHACIQRAVRRHNSCSTRQEDDMNRTMRTLGRTAGMALALSGAALFVAGQASANDRAVVVSCTDQSAGTWTVSVTFSSIEVKADRPVEVSLGSQTTTLTEPGPNGTVHAEPHLRRRPVVGVDHVVHRPPRLPEHGRAAPRPAGRMW
jgi:hypothetical protein